MTYDPGRDPQNPLDVNPQPRVYREGRTSTNTAWLLGAIALLVVGALTWYGMRDGTNVATSDRPAVTAPNTTGAKGPAEGVPMDKGAGTNRPAANSPTTEPSTRQ